MNETQRNQVFAELYHFTVPVRISSSFLRPVTPIKLVLESFCADLGCPLYSYGPTGKNTRAARIRRVPIRSEARFKQTATTVIRLDRPDVLCSARHPSIPKTEPIAKRTSINGTESKAST